MGDSGLFFLAVLRNARPNLTDYSGGPLCDSRGERRLNGMNPIIAMAAVVHENEIRLDEFALLLAPSRRSYLYSRTVYSTDELVTGMPRRKSRDASALGIDSPPRV